MSQVECLHRRVNATLPRCLVGFVAITLAMLNAGCMSYRTPGAAADFHALGITPDEVAARTETSIAQRLSRKPLAGFPTNIAIARVQGPAYRSYTSRGYGEGRFTVVTARDVESDDAFKRISSMPMIAGVAPINRLVLPDRLENEESLRQAAASVQADMLLLYTFDTQFETSKKVAPMGLLTLGLFPDRVARVSSTASAALIDTRNGYVYGLAEATGKDDQLTNAWNNADAIDSSRRKAEQKAFDDLVTQLQTMWGGVVKRYGPPGQQTPAGAADASAEPVPARAGSPQESVVVHLAD